MLDLFTRLLTFMGERDEWGTPADVLRSAEDAGLHIVSEADKRVLDACAAFPTGALDGSLKGVPYTLQNIKRQTEISDAWCEAELARRCVSKG